MRAGDVINQAGEILLGQLTCHLGSTVDGLSKASFLGCAQPVKLITCSELQPDLTNVTPFAWVASLDPSSPRSICQQMRHSRCSQADDTDNVQVRSC